MAKYAVVAACATNSPISGHSKVRCTPLAVSACIHRFIPNSPEIANPVNMYVITNGNSNQPLIRASFSR
jgi:hypothetical protein